ncbi:MAG: hypothetical protein K2H22_00540 [Muribaculaceae bacterium]|nr:hypothetical protein [Muribaculaceae bacterium]
MRKVLLVVVAWLACICAQAQTEIISETPDGTLYPTVLGSSQKTYLTAQGGFGSFSDNSGYCSSIVIDGEDMYIHNLIREYPGMDSWVKGHFVTPDVVEFEFPQPVAVDPKTGNTLYAAMVKGVQTGSSISLEPDTESPLLRLECNEKHDAFHQIMPVASDDDLGSYAGMIGLVDEKGSFKGYGEQNVSYTVWNTLPMTPSQDLDTKSYTATYLDAWNDTKKCLVKVSADSDELWIGGLCEALPDAWIKGSIQEDGNVVFDTDQYLGVANDYLYFMCCVEKNGSKDYTMVQSMTMKHVEDGYEADGSMVFNLGHSRVFLGIAVNDLKLSITAGSDPIPVNPEFGFPEWDDTEGLGVADVLILPEDVNGQALDPDNLYYRVFFDGELVALEYDESGNPVTEIKYGQESDVILFAYDWHFIIFFDPLKSIGVQSVYKAGDKEYCSDVVTYEFPQSSVSSISGDVKEIASESYYSIDGTALATPAGICIRKVTYSDGSVSVSKIVK